VELPNLYIIAGCNGAGKTTASFTILPELLNCKEYVNADEIARGLSPFQPETVSFQAGRIMLERINELIAAGADFAFETTLTTKSYLNTIRVAKAKGYRIVLVYFWLSSADLAIERVGLRVKEGGHNVPATIIRRRYNRGIINLVKKFISNCDYWLVINNSDKTYTFIAEGNKGAVTKLHDDDAWTQINTLSNETERF
jgi:predicted ABC-type ATPase